MKKRKKIEVHYPAEPELISSIKELEEGHFGKMYRGFEGYEIKTDKHAYALLIDDGQQCCEDFGYFSTPDDIEDFIGAELLKIEIVRSDCSVEEVESHSQVFQADEVQLVNFVTSLGVFQLAVYNVQDGYYGHKVTFVEDKDDFWVETIL